MLDNRNNQNGLSRATIAAYAKIAFAIHVAVFVIVNAALIAINFATSDDYLWFKWSLLGWGIGLFIHALATIAVVKGPDIAHWLVERDLRKSAAKRS